MGFFSKAKKAVKKAVSKVVSRAKAPAKTTYGSTPKAVTAVKGAVSKVGGAIKSAVQSVASRAAGPVGGANIKVAQPGSGRVSGPVGGTNTPLRRPSGGSSITRGVYRPAVPSIQPSSIAPGSTIPYAPGSTAPGPYAPVLPKIEEPDRFTYGGGQPSSRVPEFGGRTQMFDINQSMEEVQPTGPIGEPPEPPVMPEIEPEEYKEFEETPIDESELTAAEAAYQAAQGLSPEQLATQEELDQLRESTRKGYQKIEGQTIPLEFITGQSASLEKRALGLQEPLSDKLARLQAQRMGGLESAKFGLEGARRGVEEQRAGIERKRSEYERRRAESESARRFGIEQKFAQDKFNEDKRRYGIDYAMQQRKFEEDKRQFGLKYAQDQAKAAAEGGGAGAKGGQEAASSINLINTMLSNPKLGRISGAGGQFLGGIAGKGAILKNQFNQLKGILSLENRQKLKGQGAVSDFEGRTLDRAASALGRNLPDAEFMKQLKQIKGAIATSNGFPAIISVKDLRTGQIKTGSSNSQDIADAISQGFIVEYQ